ncbi:MAG: HTH domain-containing protein, partial [Spirochaetia bacterium]|nr:HTH domain-containing protein [Spirochaetia bacterium]
MAEHFGVSQRTIYRWVDALSLAGVPVYSTKGKGGGIHVSEKYALDKTVFTDAEKEEILSSLNAINALSGQTNSVAAKFRNLVSSDKNIDWIEVDFSPWNPKMEEIREVFSLLKKAVIDGKTVSFDYFPRDGFCT